MTVINSLVALNCASSAAGCHTDRILEEIDLQLQGYDLQPINPKRALLLSSNVAVIDSSRDRIRFKKWHEILWFDWDYSTPTLHPSISPN